MHPFFRQTPFSFATPFLRYSFYEYQKYMQPYNVYIGKTGYASKSDFNLYNSTITGIENFTTKGLLVELIIISSRDTAPRRADVTATGYFVKMHWYFQVQVGGIGRKRETSRQGVMER